MKNKPGRFHGPVTPSGNQEGPEQTSVSQVCEISLYQC
jgi:hypothetical protein